MPTENLIINGDFSETQSGTSSPKVNGWGTGDAGNPSGWVTNEGSAYRAQVVGGRLVFNRDDSPASGTTHVTQTVAGVEPNGEPITFSYQFGEYDYGTGDPAIRVIVRDESGQLIYDRTLTTPQTVTTTFPANSSSYTIRIADASNGTSFADPWVDNISFIAPIAAMPCFTHGTSILTENGARNIETLKVGDLIKTLDHGYQPIRWIGSQKLGISTLLSSPNLRPIRIKAGSLGYKMPEKDLVVSPQHRVLIRSKICKRMFDANEVLVAAKHLLSLEGIDLDDDVNQVEYFHILFGRHEVILANGAETESLYTGDEALKSLGASSREEIFEIFPELREQKFERKRIAARPLIGGRQGRQLASRHSKNNLKLVL